MVASALVRMDNISNNLANADAIGFKKDRVSFQDLLYHSGPTDSRRGTSGSPGANINPALIDVRTDFERLLRMWRSNQLDLEGMITDRIDLSRINDAFKSMLDGEVIRTVVEF